MHPACNECQGACCETVAIPLPEYPPPDFVRWMSYRGEIKNRRVRLEARCTQLSEAGTCTIWHSRPQPCKDYVVGGDACRDAIASRRPDTADTITRILDEWASS